MLEARRLDVVEPLFGLQAAGRLLNEECAPWIQELGLLVEAVEAGRPPGAPSDWQPGSVLRLPFSQKICREGGVVCGQALTALADTAMLGRVMLYSAVDKRPVGMVASAYAMA